MLVERTFTKLAETREPARIYELWLMRKLPSGGTLDMAMRPQGQPTE